MRTLSLRETDPVFARIREDSGNRVLRGLLLAVLVCVLFLLTDRVAGYLFSFFHMLLLRLVRLLLGESEGTSRSASLIAALLFTVRGILLAFLFCCAFENRSVRTMGLTKRHILRDYLLGAAVGTGLLSAAVMLSWAGGGVQLSGAVQSVPPGTMLLFLLGWMIQGFSEELIFRGFFMMSLGAFHKPVTAVGISSVLFAAAHLLNSGISVWALVNLTLFGVLAGLYFLRTDSIWSIAAVHSFWNMAQGNLFGFRVSGITVPETLFRFTQTDSRIWLNGGAFGPEGGAAVTAVLAAGIVIVWLLPQRARDAA